MRKGTFSISEQTQIDYAIKSIIDEEKKIGNLFLFKDLSTYSKNKLPKNFWSRVASYIPFRSVESVYDHTRRRLSIVNYKGRWTENDLLKLKILIEKYGKQWKIIGKNLNRLPSACYDKWRDALKNYEFRNKGKWTQEEKFKLIQLVTIQSKHKKLNHIYFRKIEWTRISERLKTRSYLQCRNEWNRFFIYGCKNKLSSNDIFKFIDSIFAFKIKDISEINWNSILKGVPGHKLYNKWRYLSKKFLISLKDINYPVSFKTLTNIIRLNLTNQLI
ncbi:putative myb like DNA-binding protein (nucleomorph) [Guillardia theta]|uniref:Myb like DNA-binding protein n=1 Tax=Guillardia theta TaxID=55529 RepID=Q98S93_GUITH|nr:putative myb like DNA-binding protein [Guillardia theta]AAK39690.1 putative myb like DNA-binding protein [Guillardia theta]|mmetsp:Transcript_47311/g.147936  ORF Transcript_47311/g.147936 Transcript_47311/m.147936 type:complete len:274 (-) Transcript_47311:3060-3881(-)